MMTTHAEDLGTTRGESRSYFEAQSFTRLLRKEGSVDGER